jgi:hypothetical protein
VLLACGVDIRRGESVRVYGYMRFSFAGRSDARATRNKERFEDVVAELYDPRRMERRFFMFENLCLPSIRVQSNKDFRLVILASDVMPEVYKQRLRDVTADVPQIEILYSSAENVTDAFNPHIAKMIEGVDVPTAHFRLDDDDAIAKTLVARLEAALDLVPKVRVVSFPSGILLQRQGDTSYVIREHIPYIGLGLAFLNPAGVVHNPYQCSHLEVHRRFRTFTDPDQVAYIHSAHGSSDTVARQGRRMKKMIAEQRDHDTDQYKRSITRSLRAEFPGLTINSLRDLIKQASEL